MKLAITYGDYGVARSGSNIGMGRITVREIGRPPHAKPYIVFTGAPTWHSGWRTALESLKATAEKKYGAKAGEELSTLLGAIS